MLLHIDIFGYGDSPVWVHPVPKQCKNGKIQLFIRLAILTKESNNTRNTLYLWVPLH